MVDSIAERIQLLGGVTIAMAELQVWFVSEHLVDVPLVKAQSTSSGAS